jgi:hypothetical protein
MVHEVRQLASYDALWIAPIDELYRIAFEAWDNWRQALRGSEQALQVFGARYVLTTGDWIAIDPLVDAFSAPSDGRLQALHLSAGMRVEQELRIEREGMSALALALSAVPGMPASELRIRLVEADSERLVHESTLHSPSFLAGLDKTVRTLFPGDLNLALPGKYLALEFPRQADSKGRLYRVLIEALDAAPQQGFVLWSSSELVAQCGELRVDGEVQAERRLWINASANREQFELVAELGFQRLWRYRRSQGDAWLVHEVREAPDEASMLGVTLSDGLPATTHVVLAKGWKPAPTEGRASAVDHVEVVRDVAGALELRVQNSAAGHLVFARAWYPGWRARIDGQPAELLRANFAFQALAVAPGAHHIELEYAPASWRAGLAISALAVLLAVLGWLGLARRKA